MTTIIAFLVLRVVVAVFFLQPVCAQCRHWEDTVAIVKMIFPLWAPLFAVMMIIIMIFGGLSVLFGFYAQIGAAFLCIQTLLGVCVHMKLKNQIQKMRLKEADSKENHAIFEKCQALGAIGHLTSGQKNIVIAAALLLIMLLGSGPYSITGVL